VWARHGISCSDWICIGRPDLPKLSSLIAGRLPISGGIFPVRRFSPIEITQFVVRNEIIGTKYSDDPNTYWRQALRSPSSSQVQQGAVHRAGSHLSSNQRRTVRIHSRRKLLRVRELSLRTEYKIFDVHEEAKLRWNRSIQVVVAYTNIENGKLASELLRLAKNKVVRRSYLDRWRQSNRRCCIPRPIDHSNHKRYRPWESLSCSSIRHPWSNSIQYVSFTRAAEHPIAPRFVFRSRSNSTILPNWHASQCHSSGTVSGLRPTQSPWYQQ
jgi:hypothetical protein